MTVRTQLNLLVAATTSLVLIAFLVPFGALLRDAAEQRAVSAATTYAQSVSALVALGEPPPTGMGRQITVFYPDGRVAGLPADRTGSVLLAARGRAFTAETDGGLEVLVPVQGLADGTAVVRVFVPESELHSGVWRTWWVLAALGLVLFGISLLLADRMGRRLVRSVTALAATADDLAAGQLDARISPSVTLELSRVGVALNRLAARIQALLQAERNEVADLAHRLRTPVTALRLDADTIGDPQDRARLSADVDALTREVDEVIRTARRPMRVGVDAKADLVAVAADRTAFWSALAEDSRRSLRVILPFGPIFVRLPPHDLAVALDALLENVFSHTPDGTAVRVEVTPTPSVTVEDAGPGFTAGSARGTGLGLDIARRTAEAAGGTLHTAPSPLGGARVTLVFPPLTGGHSRTGEASEETRNPHR
jgi:signal transduction histidine kinase